MNKININTLSYQSKINFCGDSQKFRKVYSQRLQQNELSETSISNLKGLASKFTNESLTYEQVLKATKRNTFMLFHKPETMEYNIKEVAKRFKNFGMTTETYLKCGLRQSTLFSISPDTIEKNINGTVNLFKNYGLTTEKFIQCGILTPSIFILKPGSIKNKIFKISEKLNVPTADILEMFLKQPAQIACNEKGIIQKYEIFKYIEENKYFDLKQPLPNSKELSQSILRKKFTNSVDTCFMQLLRNKISNGLKKGQKLPHFNLEKSLNKFIKENQRSKIEFTILDGKYAKDFIKFASKFSRSIIHKNIFKITTIVK